ncbi:long-chain-fatty-acid--CoA ligase [Amycolatopsis sp. CA-230715]|uniref:long-chain-fatty-acid--CoA ligase n=1 Tax=Amycolatopsis sp. CA-230715 TaxID=2745196 RepID=UPI001C00E123|nr:long-chain-fatty-acid--CoA ligase [Amycolatopsis sp. CA-230715]QWF77554.1 Long-chain-fatty-acid--CoA ligase FadD17 [Amycolatopsis sp. CA-230715]
MNEPTVTGLLLGHADSDRPCLRYEDAVWSWAEHVRACAEHGAALRSMLRPGVPPHVGVLAGNVPSFSFLLGGSALAGTVLVGLNPTRRGEALARDSALADCQFVLAERRFLPLLADSPVPVFTLDSPEWMDALGAQRGTPPNPAAADPAGLVMLIFTSGTSGDPKAVRCTHAKIAYPGRMLADRFGLSTGDTAYVSMPMFHSNAVMAGWAVGLAAGGTVAFRRHFSASGFLDDVRRFGATYANYVGKPLSYVVATSPRPDDADNPLRLVYGNEGAERDLAAFAERFSCRVVDAFGSTEGGIGFSRTAETPAGSLGMPPDGIEIRHPEHGSRCPPAEFDGNGRLTNGAEAIGELVNTAGAGAFAGYYGDPAADAERVRGGVYHTGDLAYADADGYCYFAGRLGDWLRVDGENLGTAPIERVLLRHPDIAEAAVYAVPDERVGDQVMAALVLRDGTLTPSAFGDFLAGQPDLGPKQLPRHVRICAAFPKTSTHKVVKRALAADGTSVGDPVWIRRADGYHGSAP